MGNTLNYYRVMKETLLDQRKKRIGPNDFKRNMRAKRSSDRATLFVLAATILFLFSSTLSADIPSTTAQEIDRLNSIEPITSPRAQAWKKKCIRHFQFKEPRIVRYKDMAPTVWCIIESRKILKGEIPFNYKKDTR